MLVLGKIFLQTREGEKFLPYIFCINFRNWHVSFRPRNPGNASGFRGYFEATQNLKQNLKTTQKSRHPERGNLHPKNILVDIMHWIILYTPDKKKRMPPKKKDYFNREYIDSNHWKFQGTFVRFSGRSSQNGFASSLFVSHKRQKSQLPGSTYLSFLSYSSNDLTMKKILANQTQNKTLRFVDMEGLNQQKW